MNNQDQFHVLLKERVDTTRRDHETAVRLLREFERMFSVSQVKAAAPIAVEVAEVEPGVTGPQPDWTPSAEAHRSGPKPGSKRPDVPPLIKAIQVVMGPRHLFNAEQVLQALKARDWLPNSVDPIGYIRYTLSKNKDIFLRAEGMRGYYHLEEPHASPQVRSVDRKTKDISLEMASDESVREAVEEVDDLLSRSGVDLSGPNPFSDQV